MMEDEAKKLVVPDEPDDTSDPATVVTILLKMPDASKETRKFFSENTIEVS